MRVIGGEDGGAVSSNGISEANINLKIVLKVQNLLEQSGAKVILTRSDENAIYDIDKKTLKEKKISDIKNRVKIGNTSSADIFVSVHLNKIPQSQYSGWQTFYKKNNENSKKLATCLQNNLNEAMQKENKRVPLQIDNVYIVKKVEIPISTFKLLQKMAKEKNTTINNILKDAVQHTYSRRLAVQHTRRGKRATS